MATVTKRNIRFDLQQTAPYGNGWSSVYTYETNASGVAINSDQATAVQVGDVVRLGVIPAGVTIYSATAIMKAFTAATTCKVGFQYVDGVDSVAVPQRDDYFLTAGTSTATAARIEMNNTASYARPITLPKDAYVILTRAGAADASASTLDLVVRGFQTGVN